MTKKIQALFLIICLLACLPAASLAKVKIVPALPGLDQITDPASIGDIGTGTPAKASFTEVTVTAITATWADINGGTLDAVTIGASTPAPATVTALVATTINVGTTGELSESTLPGLGAVLVHQPVHESGDSVPDMLNSRSRIGTWVKNAGNVDGRSSFIEMVTLPITDTVFTAAISVPRIGFSQAASLTFSISPTYVSTVTNTTSITYPAWAGTISRQVTLTSDTDNTVVASIASAEFMQPATQTFLQNFLDSLLTVHYVGEGEATEASLRNSYTDATSMAALNAAFASSATPTWFPKGPLNYIDYTYDGWDDTAPVATIMTTPLPTAQVTNTDWVETFDAPNIVNIGATVNVSATQYLSRTWLNAKHYWNPDTLPYYLCSAFGLYCNSGYNTGSLMNDEGISCIDIERAGVLTWGVDGDHAGTMANVFASYLPYFTQNGITLTARVKGVASGIPASSSMVIKGTDNTLLITMKNTGGFQVISNDGTGNKTSDYASYDASDWHVWKIGINPDGTWYIWVDGTAICDYTTGTHLALDPLATFGDPAIMFVNNAASDDTQHMRVDWVRMQYE